MIDRAGACAVVFFWRRPADCFANTLTLKAADGSPRVVATAPTTAVFLKSAPVDLCVLPNLVGLTRAGDRLVAGRVEVSTAAEPLVVEAALGDGYGPHR